MQYCRKCPDAVAELRGGMEVPQLTGCVTGDPTLSVTPETRRKVLEEAGRLDYATTRSMRGVGKKEYCESAWQRC